MSVLTACNYTEGQCWIDGESAGSVGAGGGPLVPGWGGFGDVPPEPQGAGDPLPPDCNIVKDTPCNEKCLADYVAAAEKCTEFKDDEAQKKTCDEAAFARYASCRENCAKAKNDDLEKCKDKCDEKATEEHKLCDPIEDKKQKAKCRQAAEEHRSTCYMACEDKYR